MLIGIPSTCLYMNYLMTNRIKMLSKKKVSASHTFCKTMHAFFSVVPKKTRICRYMQGKESLFLEVFFNEIKNLSSIKLRGKVA